MPHRKKRLEDCLLAASTPRPVTLTQCKLLRRISPNGWDRCGVLLLLILAFLTAAPVFGQSTKPHPSTGIQFVAANGSDLNDGLAWGTARATIGSAYSALPSCVSGRFTWPHCGTIRLGANSYSVSSPIRITSPYVSIRGRSPYATVIKYTGKSGCAIEWTGHTAFPANALPLNLSGVTIDGTEAGAGTCGLKTTDIDSFSARNVAIKGFSRAGDIGWDDTVVKSFNERMDVSMMLGNNTTSWMLEGGVGQPGYRPPDTTFGYGNFNLWINTSRSGQIGIHADNHAFIQFSDLHIIENMARGTTAIALTDHSKLQDCLVDFHFEGGTTGISTDSTSVVQVIGSIQESASMTDTFGGTHPQNYVFGYWRNSCPSRSGCGISFAPYQKAGSNYALTLGKATDVGRSAELAIGLPADAHNPPLAIGNAGQVKFWIDPSGNLHASSGYLISAGTFRLSDGEASHSFKTPYASPPVCTATDETNPVGVKVTSSTATVTVRGQGGDMVAWICTPAANN